MGFFSWDCKGCGESIKAPYDIPTPIKWHNDVVALEPDGSVQMGEYNGYGKINRDVDYHTVEMWHIKCWNSAGCPNTYSGASDYSEDQGYFYDYGDSSTNEEEWHDIGGEG